MQQKLTFGYVYAYHHADWGPKIDVVGFCFLDLASNYKPPEDLGNWLLKGQKPIYIGFGSLVSIHCMSYSSCVVECCNRFLDWDNGPLCSSCIQGFA